MNATIPYREYSFAKALRESPELRREVTGGTTRIVTPSPYEFPQQVEFRITESGDLWTYFTYDFGEKVSDFPLPPSDEHSHAVLIGNETGRILALQISDAAKVLNDADPFQHVLKLASVETPSLSADRRRTFTSSALVIGALLKNMPRDLLNELRAGLRLADAAESRKSP